MEWWKVKRLGTFAHTETSFSFLYYNLIYFTLILLLFLWSLSQGHPHLSLLLNALKQSVDYFHKMLHLRYVWKCSESEYTYAILLYDRKNLFLQGVCWYCFIIHKYTNFEFLVGSVVFMCLY